MSHKCGHTRQSENLLKDFRKRRRKNRPANGPFTVFYVCNLIKITITSPSNSRTSGPKVFLVDKRGKKWCIFMVVCQRLHGTSSWRTVIDESWTTEQYYTNFADFSHRIGLCKF